MRVSQAICALGVVVAAGCSSSDVPALDDGIRTSVIVDPVQFLGSLPCADLRGAPRSFVALLTDLDDGSLVGPSPLQPCTVPVAFERVTLGHRYAATIEVFDDVEGSGAADWSVPCGFDDERDAALVEEDERAYVRGCTEITGPGTATTTILVDATGAVDDLGCTSEGGLVDSIAIEPIAVASEVLPTIELSCGDVPARYRASIEPGTTYEFRLEANGALDPDADAPKFWAARCSATAVWGVEVPATCDPFTDRGVVAVATDELLASEGLACGDAVDALRVRVVGVSSSTLACDGRVEVRALEAGPVELEVEALTMGSVARAWTCEATVTPADTSVAACTPRAL
jgi:hypothetical protein